MKVWISWFLPHLPTWLSLPPFCFSADDHCDDTTISVSDTVTSPGDTRMTVCAYLCIPVHTLLSGLWPHWPSFSFMNVPWSLPILPPQSICIHSVSSAWSTLSPFVSLPHERFRGLVYISAFFRYHLDLHSLKETSILFFLLLPQVLIKFFC